jgi:hypothetical protein
MATLDFPAFDCKIKRVGEKEFIFDPVRRKFVSLSPEEWVRQHLINWLIVFKGYPKALFRLEWHHRHRGMEKRSDLLVLDRQGLPWLLAECKASHLPLNSLSLRQVMVYNQHFHATVLLLTNGLHHLIFQKNETGQYSQLQDLPDFKTF